MANRRLGTDRSGPVVAARTAAAAAPNARRQVRRARGDEPGAAERFDEALATLRAVYGDNVAHPVIATALHNLARW